MRYAWRSLLVLVVFLVVGFFVMEGVLAHTVQMGTPEPELRLAAAMAGLFAGGAAACIVGIITLRWRRPQP